MNINGVVWHEGDNVVTDDGHKGFIDGFSPDKDKPIKVMWRTETWPFITHGYYETSELTRTSFLSGDEYYGQNLSPDGKEMF